MADTKVVVDTNKSDGIPQVEFSADFLKSFDENLSIYDSTLDYLDKLVHGGSVGDEEFGVCNCSYQMIYITPHDISSYISYLFKAISKKLITCDITDMEKLSVELAKRFITDNGGVRMSRDNILAASKYSDPRVQTLMDLVVQSENTFFDRSVYSKFEMQQRAKDLKADYDKMNGMHFVPSMKAVVKALPNTIKSVMKESLKNGIVCCDCDLVMTYIETFILFACSINTCTLTQMIGYVQPESTFFRKEASNLKANQTVQEMAFNGFYTECSLIKTNDMNIRARIPFDCNMKDVVLQDVTPAFKDTKSALHFMVKNPRSPIHVLLVKYATDKQLAGHHNCRPAMELFAPYFRHCCDCGDPLQYEKQRVGFITDVNWLDKIAYGNQFMDGNYRMDAMGNETRHPILTTLEMLHKMYCGCGLKTNEDLADHILKIGGLMHEVIMSSWSTMNRQLTTDILCVLGDCFTRCVLKLYYNNCNVIVASDDMDDTMVPGYTYCEQFVFQEADNQKPAQPTVTVQGQAPNTAQKTGALSTLATAIRQFMKWLQTKFATFGKSFAYTNGAKAKWVESHKDLNNKIGEAISTGKFKVQLGSFTKYDVKVSTLTERLNSAKSAIATIDGALKDGTLDEKEIRELRIKMYPPGVGEVDDPQLRSEMVQNFVLYGTTQKPAPTSMSMTKDVWDDIVGTLQGTQQAIDKLTDSFKDALNALNTKVDAVNKAAEAQQAKAAQGQNNGTPQESNGTENANTLFNFVKEFTNDFALKTMNSLARVMYKNYYEIYKQVVDKFNMQNKNEQQAQQQQQQQTQQGEQQVENAEPAAQGQTPANNNPTT